MQRVHAHVQSHGCALVGESRLLMVRGVNVEPIP